MSERGRCPCGFVSEAVRVRNHQMDCLVFAEAFRTTGPGATRTAEQEYEHWAAEGRPAAKAAAHAASVADTDARRAAMKARFATRDILDEE